jgi:hypothetical protein
VCYETRGWERQKQKKIQKLISCYAFQLFIVSNLFLRNLKNEQMGSNYKHLQVWCAMYNVQSLIIHLKMMQNEKETMI